jgi:RNA-directed DNA polymerase
MEKYSTDVLGIPTGKDRVMQAIVKAALEPEWPARFEANS